jgi:hypothetical protein
LYTVYKISEGLRDRIEEISWTDLSNQSERIGVIPTSAVEFDESRRGAIKADVLDCLEADKTDKCE